MMRKPTRTSLPHTIPADVAYMVSEQLAVVRYGAWWDLYGHADGRWGFLTGGYQSRADAIEDATARVERGDWR